MQVSYHYKPFREARLAKGWSLLDAVVQLRVDYNKEVSQQTLASWELGETAPAGDDLAILLNLYGMKATEVFVPAMTR